MDYQLIWTISARADLRGIAEFIARENPAAALRLGELLFARVDQLTNFPQLGRVVPERGQMDLREILFQKYRVIYRLREEQKAIEILRVWHGARGEPEIPANESP